MLKHSECCERCNAQYTRTMPHKDLDLISKVPKGALYICKTCRFPWRHCFEKGWMGMAEASAK